MATYLEKKLLRVLVSANSTEKIPILAATYEELVAECKYHPNVKQWFSKFYLQYLNCRSKILGLRKKKKIRTIFIRCMIMLLLLCTSLQFYIPKYFSWQISIKNKKKSYGQPKANYLQTWYLVCLMFFITRHVTKIFILHLHEMQLIE